MYYIYASITIYNIINKYLSKYIQFIEIIFIIPRGIFKELNVKKTTMQ